MFGSWSTPTVVHAGHRDELVMPLPGDEIGGPGRFKAYDPASGKVLWQCDGLGNEVYAMPIVAPGGDLIVGISGHNGPTLAIRPGGTGNVTRTHRLWQSVMQIPQRIGSGIIHDELLFLSDANGIAECLEARTGESVWKERLGGDLWGSLLLAGRQVVRDKPRRRHVRIARGQKVRDPGEEQYRRTDLCPTGAVPRRCAAANPSAPVLH